MFLPRLSRFATLFRRQVAVSAAHFSPVYQPEVAHSKPSFFHPVDTYSVHQYWSQPNLYWETNRMLREDPPMFTIIPSRRSIFTQAQQILLEPNQPRDQRLINCLQFLVTSRTLDNDILYNELEDVLNLDV